MKNLNKNQAIGVFAGLGFVAYLLFGSVITQFFNPTAVNSNIQTMNEGVTVQEVNVGQGAVAESGDVLTVHYIGKLADGRVFESSLDTNTPFTFTIGRGGVIRGWDEGLLGMRVGGKRILTITPSYGYGDQSVGAIPANSTLIFEVDLLNVQKSN
jgi:FKBP-type peptidyl-prolyl cis-trans isomerase FkpA